MKCNFEFNSYFAKFISWKIIALWILFRNSLSLGIKIDNFKQSLSPTLFLNLPRCSAFSARLIHSLVWSLYLYQWPTWRRALNKLRSNFWKLLYTLRNLVGVWVETAAHHPILIGSSCCAHNVYLCTYVYNKTNKVKKLRPNQK